MTTKRFTGQYHESSLPGGEGLSYYGARWYDAQLGLFIQPDTLVPDAGTTLDYNRYAYVRFNPLKYNDPTGHQAACMMDSDGSFSCSPNTTMGGKTLTVDLQSFVSTQAPILPTSANQATVNQANTPSPRMVAPTPTQAPRMKVASPFTPAPTPPPGSVNGSDLYWTGAIAMLDEMPESLGHAGLVRAVGRGVGQFVPVIGYGASIGPNISRHWVAGDPLEETLADFATDSLGFGVSGLGGKAVGALTGMLVSAAQPEAAPVAAPIANTIGSVSGGLGISIFWDLRIAPQVSSWLQQAWDRVTNLR